jgi:hypothetical protein
MSKFEYALLDTTQGAWPDSTGVMGRMLEAEQILSPKFCDVWGLQALAGRVITDPSQATNCDMVFQFQNTDPNVAGALAYHDEQNGVPYARMLTDTVLGGGGGVLDGGAMGVSVLSTFLHELWESVVDLYVDDLIMMPSGVFVFKEVSDPVQAVPLQVTFADGTIGLASDAVFPRYFDAQAPVDGSVAFSLAGAPTAPFQILPNGYQSQFDPSKIADPNGPVVTVWGYKIPEAVRAAKIIAGRMKLRVERYLAAQGRLHGRDFVWSHRTVRVSR